MGWRKRRVFAGANQRYVCQPGLESRRLCDLSRYLHMFNKSFRSENELPIGGRALALVCKQSLILLPQEVCCMPAGDRWPGVADANSNAEMATPDPYS